MVAPIIAAKGAETAAKALTGDVYVRKWTAVKGKGKKKREIDHEVHVNPLTMIVGAAAGLTAAGVGLWLTQRKLGRASQARTLRLVRYYDEVYGEPYTTMGVDENGYKYPVYHEGVLLSGGYAIVYSKRGVPVTFTNDEGKRFIKHPGSPDLSSWFFITPLERGKGWEHDDATPIKDSAGRDSYGTFKQYAVTIRNPNKKPFMIDERSGLFEGWF